MRGFKKPHTFGYLAMAMLVCCVFYVALTVPDPPVEGMKQDIEVKVSSLQERLGHAEILLQRRWRDIMQAEAKMDGGRNSSLQLPSIFDFLPHMKNSSRLDPSLRIANATRSNIKMVLGIPTVRRDLQSYLPSTVDNLISNMNPEERDSTLIVILLADTNSSKVEAQLQEIHASFEEHLRSGLVEVINPPKNFYPDMNQLKPTLGDPPERVKWRTKQAYDFAYLMMYASSRGEFYVQLEDDILSKPGFISQMMAFAQKQMASGRRDFFVLDFCSLGFIGKMFKCVDLLKFAAYILTFANDQPVDWILDHYVQTKVCRFDKDAKHCRKQKLSIWITHKPSLFQHVGTHSSLKGKVQKLKDRQFGKVALFVAHKDNIPAEVVTSMKTYKTYNIKRAYVGDSFFWALLPQSGDHITITFFEPATLEHVYFRSGDAEHPNDRFVNATIEVRPFSKNDSWRQVASFDPNTGVAVCSGLEYAVSALRVVVLSDHDHWAILSEIQVKGSAVLTKASLL